MTKKTHRKPRRLKVLGSIPSTKTNRGSKQKQKRTRRPADTGLKSPLLGHSRQKESQFKASASNVVRPYLKIENTNGARR